MKSTLSRANQAEAYGLQVQHIHGLIRGLSEKIELAAPTCTFSIDATTYTDVVPTKGVIGYITNGFGIEKQHEILYKFFKHKTYTTKGYTFTMNE